MASASFETKCFINSRSIRYLPPWLYQKNGPSNKFKTIKVIKNFKLTYTSEITCDGAAAAVGRFFDVTVRDVPVVTLHGDDSTRRRRRRPNSPKSKLKLSFFILKLFYFASPLSLSSLSLSFCLFCLLSLSKSDLISNSSPLFPVCCVSPTF